MLCKKPTYQKTAGGLVPCGQCLHCRINIVQKWTCRLLLEYMANTSSCWATITYNEDFLPKTYIDPLDGNIYESYQGLGTLAPDHMRLFIMRLRKKLGNIKIRYFYCGEYGDKFGRPHYHICLFGIGAEWEDTIRSCWTDPISKLSMGNVKIDPLTSENIRYTCGYAVKKLTKKTDERLNGSYPEFVRRSIGIGKVQIDKIAKAMDCKSLKTYYYIYGDIPRVYSVMGKEYPLDRYTRHRIIKFLAIDKEAIQNGYKKYQQEMQEMYVRAQNIAPRSVPSKAFLLEKQYELDNAQKLRNSSARLEIFLQTKEKKL